MSARQGAHPPLFFIASKLVWGLLHPSTLLLWATLTGLALTHTPLAQLGRRLAWVAGALLAFCALTSLCVVLIRPLEDRFPTMSIERGSEPAGIITLGGALSASLTRARGPIALSSSGARLTEAMALALRFPKARVIFSGGTANLLGQGISEGEAAQAFFTELGLPTDRVTIEGNSRNTFENAQFTRDLVKPNQGETWVLVTSAFHMPRAVAAFEKAGFEIVPYPVDYQTFGDSSDYLCYTFAPLKALPVLDLAAKEWIGLAAYRLTRKTATFLPSEANIKQ